jgi:hypothetical protein
MNEEQPSPKALEDEWFQVQLAPEPPADEQALTDPWFDRFKPLSSFPPPPSPRTEPER